MKNSGFDSENNPSFDPGNYDEDDYKIKERIEKYSNLDIEEDDEIINIKRDDAHKALKSFSEDDEFKYKIQRLIKENSEYEYSLSPEESEVQVEEIERCAWYQPIHYYSEDFGIFIREKCIKDKIKKIAKYLTSKTVVTNSLMNELYKAALLWFFYHEYFHHKVESFGIRYLLLTNDSRYPVYKKNIYKKYFLSDDCREEALANAYIFQKLPNLIKDKNLKRAVKKHWERSMPNQPKGYRMASLYKSKKDFEMGENRLKEEVISASLCNSPKQPDIKWNVATLLSEGLFKAREIDFNIVISKKRRPGDWDWPSPPELLQFVSAKKIIKNLKSMGYEEIPGGGKGGHRKFKHIHHDEKKTIILPSHGAVKKGTCISIAKAATGLDSAHKALNRLFSYA